VNKGFTLLEIKHRTNHNLRKRQRRFLSLTGFTLLEILVATLILTFIVVGILAVLIVADMNWSFEMGLLDLQQQARQVMDGMTRELRQSKPGYDITISGGSDITFKVVDVDNTINYSLNDENQIIRQHPPGTTKILAQNISELSFCCLGKANCQDCSGVEVLKIKLTALKTIRQRQLSFNLTEQVKIRNE
jgi:Tfp pilus assembly protein PilW